MRFSLALVGQALRAWWPNTSFLPKVFESSAVLLAQLQRELESDVLPRSRTGPQDDRKAPALLRDAPRSTSRTARFHHNSLS